jgi:hypothetical protein
VQTLITRKARSVVKQCLPRAIENFIRIHVEWLALASSNEKEFSPNGKFTKQARGKCELNELWQ